MADRSKAANKKRAQLWRYHIDTWSRSGLAQNAYCRANNLKSNRLTYWKNKFKKQHLPVEFVQISSAQISASHNFQPRQGLRLNVGTGFQVEIPDEFSNATLTQILHVLRQF
ncbi:IS66 family insertion sequence element accessory protein TnpB [bacterium]|nr:IS66 family insertion sequence element accessory protein TnpB [bacterium]